MSQEVPQKLKTEVLVLGSGPGGYTAAFRAADLGKQVILVERYEALGGVCLNVGCIPSKALLHLAEVITGSQKAQTQGITFGAFTLEKDKVLAWKNGIINKLTGGLKMLAKQRKIRKITGEGTLVSPNQLNVTTPEGLLEIQFEHAILAAGSRAVRLPFIPEDPRIFTSTGALELRDLKGELLVIGGGIIGLEMATVYEAMGVKVTVVEFMDQIIPGASTALTKVLHKQMAKRGVTFLLKTKVVEVTPKKEGIWVTFEGENAPKDKQQFQQILVAVGRTSNADKIGAAAAGIACDPRGFVKVDKQNRTNISNVFAIGDLVGQPMLAHKAIPEGKVAAEVIAGMKHYFDPRAIASVAYTDPELAWVGLTETEADTQGIPYEKAAFPWAASGRALSLGCEEGVTQLLFCPKTHRLLGAGIVGSHAGDLIAEIALAIEMGCDAEDLALTIHPHPTLSETIAQSAEIFEGTITDLYLPKAPKGNV